MKKSMIRQILLIAVSILNWIFSVGYIKNVYNMLNENTIEYADNITIDGSDFTPLANLAITGFSGLTALFTIGLCVFFATIFILIFAILLRVTTIRKKDLVTESEVTFTRRLIVISSVFAFIVGILSTDINLIWLVIYLSWQQPMFMIFIYYLPLNNRFQKGVEIDYSKQQR